METLEEESNVAYVAFWQLIADLHQKLLKLLREALIGRDSGGGGRSLHPHVPTAQYGTMETGELGSMPSVASSAFS